MIPPVGQPQRTRWYFPALVLILLLALLLRVWFWQDQARAGAVTFGDDDEYYRGAIHLLLRGDYYDDGQWLRPPMTSIALAVDFGLLGVDVPLAMLLQVASSLVTIALLTALVRRLFHRDAAAIAAAAAAALFLPFAGYASLLLSENLFTLFIALALVILERASWRPRWLFAGGMAVALAILTRPVLLFALPLFLLWAWWERHKFLPALRSFAWLMLGVILLIAPWTARNYSVYHQLVIVDTNGGVSFWFGTLLDPSEKSLQAYWNTHLPNSALRQQAAIAKGLDNIRRAPLRWLARSRDKVVGLWQLHLRNLANNSQRGASVMDGSVAYAFGADVEYVILMIAALVGLALSRREERSLLLLGWPLYMTALSAVTLGTARFREPLMISVIAYAAPVLADPRGAWGQLRLAGLGRQFSLAASVAAFVLLIYSNAYLPFFRSEFWLAVASLNHEEAAIQQALTADRDSVFVYLALGQAKLARNDENGALGALDQAASLEPDHPDVEAQRIAILRARGDLAGPSAAMQAIVDDKRDDPQWYEWEWLRVPYAPRDAVSIDAPAVGVMRGVYASTTEQGIAFRWTLSRAEFRVARPGATTLTLRLRADSDKPVEVRFDGAPLQILVVTSAWRDYALPLLAPAGASSLVELRSTTEVVSVEEPYARGVAVAALKLDQ